VISNLLQDLQYSLRQLRRSRAFTPVAVLTLALGIGLNTAIFSVIYGVLLRPLPYPEPNRLVLVSERAEHFPLLSASYQNFNDWRSQSSSFEEFGAIRDLTMSLTGNGEAEQVPTEMVTGNLLHLLGVGVSVGRPISEADDTPASAPVALLGYGLWERRFSGSQQVIGQPITLNNKSYTIVGILPKNFEVLQQKPDVVIPMGPWAVTLPDDRSWHPGIFPVARLKNGVSLAQARAEMSTIAKRLLARYPDTNIAIDAIVNPMQDQIVSDARPVLLTLFGAVAFVLLIACGNVANLLLTRATARRKEISLRLALGASRGRIIQQLITEGILLSIMGAIAGVAVAFAGLSSLLHFAGTSIPAGADVRIDYHVLLFTAAVSIFAGVFFGLAPAGHLGLHDLRSALNDTDRGAVSKHTKGLRGLLVVSEVSLALLLLIGAGLFVRSLDRLSNVNLGFSVERILIADLPVAPAVPGKADANMNFYEMALNRLRTLPGVKEVGAVSVLPVSGKGSILHFNIYGRPPHGPSEYVMANYRVVSSGYLPALQIPLLEGRWINDSDREKSKPVVVINRAMAKAFFNNQSPIGKRLQIGAFPDETVPWMEVIGVVGDVKQSLASEAPTEMYVPFRQANEVLPVTSLSVLLRAEGDPNSLSAGLRNTVHQINSNQPVVRIRTMEDNVAQSVAQPRFRTILLTIFAVVALVIAAVGIYGVMAYAMLQRSREIGIRMALGCSSEGIFLLILNDGMRLTGIGVIIGTTLGLMIARSLKSLLFGISSSDGVTLAISIVVVLGVGLAASFLPARRASRIEVAEIMRES